MYIYIYIIYLYTFFFNFLVSHVGSFQKVKLNGMSQSEEEQMTDWDKKI